MSVKAIIICSSTSGFTYNFFECGQTPSGCGFSNPKWSRLHLKVAFGQVLPDQKRRCKWAPSYKLPEAAIRQISALCVEISEKWWNFDLGVCIRHLILPCEIMRVRLKSFHSKTRMMQCFLYNINPVGLVSLYLKVIRP